MRFNRRGSSFYKDSLQVLVVKQCLDKLLLLFLWKFIRSFKRVDRLELPIVVKCIIYCKLRFINNFAKGGENILTILSPHKASSRHPRKPRIILLTGKLSLVLEILTVNRF